MRFFHTLSVVTRAKDWRLSFVPFILGCVYMWLWWFKLPFSFHTVALTLLSLVTTVGFASLGYFINEFFDITSDAKAGKLNKLAFLPPTLQVGIFAAATALTFLPWIWLPSTLLSWLLIGLQILLFLIYSLPFPRLKEATYLSVIIDSLYAYVVPLVLSFYTFSLIAAVIEFPLWFYLFVIAVFCIGLRNIIIHQVSDVMKDKKSGMATLPMVLGIDKTRLVIRLVFFYEAFFVLLWCVIFYFSRAEILFWLIAFLPFAFISLKELSDKNHDRLNNLIVNHTYQFILPILMIIFATSVNPNWLFILPLHVLFFVPQYFKEKSYWLLRYLVSAIHRFTFVDVRNAASALVNYPVYFTFRLFGVDLKREGKSALQYLQSRFQKN